MASKKWLEERNKAGAQMAKSARMPGGIWANVQVERDRQDAKWGIQNHHPYKWLAILGEEVGDANEAVLEGKLVEYHKELIHVAAVAIAAAESLERNLERDNATTGGKLAAMGADAEGKS